MRSERLPLYGVEVVSVFGMTRRYLVLTGLILVTCIVAAIIGSAANLDPSRSWSQEDAGSGSPSTGSHAGVGAAELVDARRATGEAASQAALLTSGTGELVDGATQLEDGAGELIDGIGSAADGAGELSAGMTELQAGVGQLGSGANEIADGVATATEPLVGLGAVRGQIVGSLDNAIDSLDDTKDPELVKLRDDLTSLRDQANNIPIDEGAVTELERLRDGTRDLANQLSVPGYGFHDGVYAATEGAQDLSAGLTELDTGAGDARTGITDLREGAEKVDTLASNTDEKIGAINRAIPVVGWEDETTRALAPQISMLLAAFGMLGGFALAIGASLVTVRRWLFLLAGGLGVTVAGVVALLVLATGQPVSAVLGAAGVLLLSVFAAAGVTRVLVNIFGTTWGATAAGLAGTVQLGVVGWVWRVAATSDVAAWLRVASEMTPLHWATAALTVLGNDGTPQLLWTGLGVLGILAAVGVVAMATPTAKAV